MNSQMVTTYSLCLCAENHQPLPPSLQKPSGVFELCKKFGKIYRIKYNKREKGKKPGIAIAIFLEKKSVIEAIKELNNKMIEDVVIWCPKDIRKNSFQLTDSDKFIESPDKETLDKKISEFKVLSVNKVDNRKWQVFFETPIELFRYNNMHKFYDINTEASSEVTSNTSSEVTSNISSEVISNISSEVTSNTSSEKDKMIKNVVKASLIVISSGIIATSLYAFIKHRKH